MEGTGYGRYRVKVEIDGKKQEIGDDYSRDLALDVFAKRYVVADDPTAKLATYPKKIEDAIARAKIVLGMTREQVLMSAAWLSGQQREPQCWTGKSDGRCGVFERINLRI